ncbi:hypothetical protein C2G38_2215819 [Gigaspora rosea]|uniref:Uncharacterized protein n=1 Tax=Gigaspora rosea TaxID=44941 RepID=A0A397U9G2_9GLOM|nr:hypothetical protein C2G38_2215819 [Gigaspora rosea]
MNKESICGVEKHELLVTAFELFNDELISLLQNGFYDLKDNRWPVEFWFSSNWKCFIKMFFYELMKNLYFNHSTNSTETTIRQQVELSMKLIEKFPVTSFISGQREKDIKQLWRKFLELYNIM